MFCELQQQKIWHKLIIQNPNPIENGTFQLEYLRYNAIICRNSYICLCFGPYVANCCEYFLRKKRFPRYFQKLFWTLFDCCNFFCIINSPIIYKLLALALQPSWTQWKSIWDIEEYQIFFNAGSSNGLTTCG